PITAATTTSMTNNHESLAESARYCSCQRLRSILANRQAKVVINNTNAAIGKPAVDRFGGASEFVSGVGIDLRKFLCIDDVAIRAIGKAPHQAGGSIVGNKPNRTVTESEIYTADVTAGKSADGQRRSRVATEFAVRQHAVAVWRKVGTRRRFG